jgi:hypothetical protein
MDKKRILEELIAGLKAKTDEEVIRHYETNGVSVLSYNPGEAGSVVLHESDNVAGSLTFSSTVKSSECVILHGFDSFLKYEVNIGDVA